MLSVTIFSAPDNHKPKVTTASSVIRSSGYIIKNSVLSWILKLLPGYNSFAWDTQYISFDYTPGFQAIAHV